MALAGAGLGVFLAAGQVWGFEPTAAEKAWLAGHPEIRVGVSADNPPLNYADRQGGRLGYAADLLSEVDDLLGGVVRTSEGTFGELAAGLKEGRLDALMDATPNAGQERWMVFTRPYLEVPATLVAKRDSRFYASAKMLLGSSLAVEKDSPAAWWFRENHPKVRLKQYGHAREALDGVARGEASAYAGNRAVALYLLQREMLSNMQLQGRLEEVPSALCIGVRKDMPELAGLLDRALEEALRTKGRALRAKWHGAASRASVRFEPGPELEAWLAGRETLRVGVPDDAAPMSFADAGGAPSGVAMGFLEVLDERLDGRIEAVAGPRAELAAELRAGRLDALMDVGGGDAGVGMAHSKPYANVPNVIVGRRGSRQHVDLESLSNRVVAVAAGFPAAEHLRRHRKHVRVMELGSIGEALAAVSEGRAEAFVGGRAAANWALARNMLADLEIQGTAWEIDAVTRIGARADEPELAATFNAALASLASDEVQAVFERWAGEGWRQASELSWVQLTPEEKKWIEEHPVVLVGSNPRWAPLEFTDHTGAFNGVACEYLERFGRALGVTFRQVSVPSWRQAQAKLRDGEVDLLTSLNKASARRLDVEFTTPYQSLPTAIFTHENKPYVGQATELKGMKVGVVAGYGLETYLQGKVPGLAPETVYDVPTGLKQLESGELDAFVGSLLVASHYIQRGGHARIKVGGELDFVYQPAFAVRRDMKILADILSRALAGIDEQEKAGIARKWMAVTYEQSIDYAKLYKYVAGALGLMGLFAYWNRRMAAEIRRRRAVEESLRKSEESLVAANKELEAFSYSVSHDLRAPLRHVSGFVQLLQNNAKGKLDATGMRYVEVIAGAAKRMGELIDDLLSFSRMGRAQMHLETVPLGPLVEECRKELEPETQGRKIEWAIGALPEVKADRPLLRQVLANLLGNAVKYSGKREEARIEVAAKTEGGETVVSVKDNGAGFDMKYADKLFGVFQRLHGENEFEGTGIGLANVRRIVVRHGGRTWAEGEVGKGAAFYFSLPAAPAEAEKEGKA